MNKIPADMQPGCIHETKNYGYLEIVSYINKKKVHVKFCETGYLTSAESGHIRRGNVKDHSSVRPGAKYHTKNYGELEILEYKNAGEVSIRFLNTGSIKVVSISNVLKGTVKDAFSKTVYGVGYFGDGPFKSWKNGKHTKAYTAWHGMIKRCYDPQTQDRQPTYIGCTVCDDWLNFQNFADWFQKNSDEKLLSSELDKDIKIDGNRQYSPDACSIVTRKDNNAEMANRVFAKEYCFLSKAGIIVTIRNLRLFCRENNLDQSAMLRVSKGKQSHHKGWVSA